MSASPATPAAAVATTSSIIICSLPRSGSWLLAKALETTGVAGHPEEYLRKDLEDLYTRRWELPRGTGTADLLAAMLRAGTSENGVFGLKTHWQDCAGLLARLRREGASGDDAAVLAGVFPAPRYIHLVRRDTVRQALSWARALDSNVWWALSGEPEQPSEIRGWDPDLEKVDVLHQLLLNHEREWQRFFTQAGIRPVEVVYEDFVAGYEPTVRRVVEEVGLGPLAAGRIASPPLRPQSDGQTRRWHALYQRRRRLLDGAAEAGPPAAPAQSGGAPASAGRPRAPAGQVEVRPGPTGAPTTVSREDIAAVLAHRRWLWRAQPFPHVVARDVFRPEVYAAMERAVAGRLERGPGAPGGFRRNIPGYDALGCNFASPPEWPLSLFTSRAWHDLVAAVTGVEAAGHVNCGLHHHLVGSRSGSVHNDLNPGWFVGTPDADRVLLTDAAVCSYSDGTPGQPGLVPVEYVRGAAVLFFLNNGPWQRGDGGVLGLYNSLGDPVDRPTMAIPPLDNSLVMFECTPHSLHAFVHNRRSPRSSLIMWIHRPRAEVVRRWGNSAIVNWSRRNG